MSLSSAMGMGEWEWGEAHKVESVAYRNYIKKTREKRDKGISRQTERVLIIIRRG